MKYLFYLIIAGLSSLTVAQGNLQFNQVLLIDNNTATVPPGKVWKIEGVGLSSYSSFFSVSVAGQQVFLKNTNTGYGPVFDSFPYWINGGQNVFFSGLNSGVASILEFNIVP